MINNGMHPQNGLILDENGEVHSLVQLIKGIGSGGSAREIELGKSATHIQWRYVGEEQWTDLVALAELKGAKGDTGAKGADGFGTESQYNDIIARLERLEGQIAG